MPKPLPFELKHPSGLVVRGDVHLPAGEGRSPVVVLCHGFKGFKDWGFHPYLADQLAAEGLAAVRMNFSLNGIGPDPESITELDRFAANTVSQELRDLELTVDAVRAGRLPGADRMDRRRLGLFGHSRGAGVVLLKALQDPEVRAVVTWGAVARFWEGVDPAAWKAQGFLEVLNTRTGQRLKVDYAAWEDLERYGETYDFLRRLPSLHARALFLHGTEDAAVPCEASQRLSARLSDRAALHLIRGGDHTFGAVHPFKGTTPALQEAVGLTTYFLNANV